MLVLELGTRLKGTRTVSQKQKQILAAGAVHSGSTRLLATLQSFLLCTWLPIQLATPGGKASVW